MKNFLHNTWKHRAHIVMALPAFLVLLFFAYIPMGGLVMAFKSYDYTKGIWGSPWNGLDNFKFLIASKSTFLSMTKNTLFYYVIFTGLGTVLNVVLAIAIDQCVFKKCAKTMQTVMIIPVFISYAAVQFIVYAFISTDTGILNNLFNARVRYYTTASYWPVILTIVKMWNSVGYGSVLYMSVLAGIDSSLYEAAEMDGCGKMGKMWHITLPGIRGTIGLLFIMGVGGLLSSGVEQIWLLRTPGNMSLADTLDVYVLRIGIQGGQFGYATAIGLIQGLVGLVLVVVCNRICKKITEVGLW